MAECFLEVSNAFDSESNDVWRMFGGEPYSSRIFDSARAVYSTSGITRS